MLAVADRGDDRELRIGLERARQQPADHRAVVDHHDADRAPPIGSRRRTPATGGRRRG